MASRRSDRGATADLEEILEDFHEGDLPADVLACALADVLALQTRLCSLTHVLGCGFDPIPASAPSDVAGMVLCRGVAKPARAG
jgi:hypothetical protein